VIVRARVEAQRGLQPEFLQEHMATALELSDRLVPIAGGQVRLDQSIVRGLPQRLGGHRCQTGFDGCTVLAHQGQPDAHRLKRVESQVVELLATDNDPVVFVPAGQQVGGELGQALRSENVGAVFGGVQEPVGSRFGHVNVDIYVWWECEFEGAWGDQRGRDPLNPPDRRSQAGVGFLWCGVRPQLSGDVGPADCAFVENEKGDKPLGA